MTDFNRLVKYVERETGFATSHYDDSYLKRRVSARMRRTGTEEYAEYRSLLEDSAEERAELVDALSINVTSFFRNPGVWERVREILRALTRDRRRVKLWSAACSDGREPYTMAMLALEDPEIDASKIEITATDINAAILETARQGVYWSTQTTDIEEQVNAIGDYSDYFEQDGDRFEVTEEVRSMVTFEQHDLIRGKPKSDFDLVVCRNLFIYIDTEYKLPILRTVRESLNDDGYLVIGKTETLPDELKVDFDALDKRLRVYRLT